MLELFSELRLSLGHLFGVIGNLSLLLGLSSSNGHLVGLLSSFLGSLDLSSLLISSSLESSNISESLCLELLGVSHKSSFSSLDVRFRSGLGSSRLSLEFLDSISRGSLSVGSFKCLLLSSGNSLFIFSSLLLKSILIILNFLSLLLSLLNGSGGSSLCCTGSLNISLCVGKG